MSRALAIAALSFLLSACGRSPYPGYKRVSDDVHLRFHALGDGEVPVRDGDSVRVRFRAALRGEPQGSLLSTERWYAAKDLRRDALVPVMERWHEGDSLGIIAPATMLPWPVIAPHPVDEAPAGTMVAVEIALLAVRTPAMMREAEERHRRNDPEGFERRLIEGHLARSGVEWEPWGTSLLHRRITGTATDTARVKPGETVVVTWTGRRLEDGHVFDDTGRNGHPFTFRFGDPDQVVKGIEVAVHLLREGQEGVFVIPSEMAFGARGIGDIIGPWTPVEYTVRLERIEGR